LFGSIQGALQTVNFEVVNRKNEKISSVQALLRFAIDDRSDSNL